jgi:hypothetical protein
LATSDVSEESKREAFRLLQSVFAPGAIAEAAYRTEEWLASGA